MSEYPKYSKGAYSSILGLAVMRQKSATENSQMIASIVLREKEAGELADALIATLTRSESPVEKASGEMYKALHEIVPAFNMSRIIMNSAEARQLAAEIVMRGRAALAEFDKAKEGK